LGVNIKILFYCENGYGSHPIVVVVVQGEH